jgi:hypothetical protein
VDFSEHVIISAAGSAAMLAGGLDPAGALAFGVVGVFIDLDHLADYWPETGFNVDVARFMGYFSSRQNKRMLLFLHGWEWPLGAALALFDVGCHSAWPYWACVGWLVHLLLDNRFNGLRRWTYFFFYRWSRGFKSEQFYDD